MEEKKENIVNFDFQGWPEFKMSIKDIIERIGGELNEETNKWEIPNEGWLVQCPTILHDDGMGYGVNPEYIVDINFDLIEQTCNIWADKKLDNIELYVKTGFYPGVFFKIGDKYYCVNEICYVDAEHSKCIIRAVEWFYKETKDENGNAKVENPVGQCVDFDLDYVLEHMEKTDNSLQDGEVLQDGEN